MTSVNFFLYFLRTEIEILAVTREFVQIKAIVKIIIIFVFILSCQQKGWKKTMCVCVCTFSSKLFRITMFFFFFVIVNSMYCVVLLLLYDLSNHFRYFRQPVLSYVVLCVYTKKKLCVSCWVVMIMVVVMMLMLVLVVLLLFLLEENWLTYLFYGLSCNKHKHRMEKRDVFRKEVDSVVTWMLAVWPRLYLNQNYGLIWLGW